MNEPTAPLSLLGHPNSERMSALHPFINKSKRSSFAILPTSENETAPAPPTQEITTQTHRKSALSSPTSSLSLSRFPRLDTHTRTLFGPGTELEFRFSRSLFATFGRTEPAIFTTRVFRGTARTRRNRFGPARHHFLHDSGSEKSDLRFERLAPKKKHHSFGSHYSVCTDERERKNEMAVFLTSRTGRKTMNEKGEIDSNRLSPFDRVIQIEIIYENISVKEFVMYLYPA